MWRIKKNQEKLRKSYEQRKNPDYHDSTDFGAQNDVLSHTMAIK